MWFTHNWTSRFLFCIAFAIHQYSWVSTASFRPNYDTEHVIGKRFGQSVIEERLPFWLERRAAIVVPNHEWEYDEIEPAVNDIQGPEDIAVELGMSQRQDEQVEELRKLLNRKYTSGRNEAIQLVRRDGKAGPVGVGHLTGFRSHIAWQPIAIGIICSVFGVMVVVGAVVLYQKFYIPKRITQDSEFGGLRPAKPSPTGSLLGDTSKVSLEGDRKLAHSAQMYHYQHQKQQMLAVERASDAAQVSEEGSESDLEEGDFTVYECPGLAATDQLEVENPLYEGDTATNGPSTNGSYGEIIGASDLEENSDSTPTTKVEEH